MKKYNKAYIKSLKYSDDGLLQVIVENFILQKEESGLQLTLSIDDYDKCLVKGKGRRYISEIVTKERDRKTIQKRLNEFLKDKNHLGYNFNCSTVPLRYANCGVLPIIKFKDKDYFCLFYRTIYPVGWNIANGASNNLHEILHPDKILSREFGEEFIIIDKTIRKDRFKKEKRKEIFLHNEEDENYSSGTQNMATGLWQNKLDERFSDSVKYEKLPIPIKWINGPDKIDINWKKKKFRESNFFISVLPEDNSIELDKIAYIKLNDNITILDGEIGSYGVKKEIEKNVLVNRIIGLFPVDEVLRKLNTSKEFFPEFYFFNGKEEKFKDVAGLMQSINSHRNDIKEFIKVIDPKAFTNYDKKEIKFNLCSVSESIIQKYYKWLEDSSKTEISSKGVKRENISKNKFKIFISFKSKDEQIAQWLYDYLLINGYKKEEIFCSGISIPMLGESDYSQAIDDALNVSKILIVIATELKHFSSGWVDYEWKSFYNEIKSGYKQDGKVFTLTDKINFNDFPYGLRQVQNVPYNPTSIKDSFENLYQYIESYFIKYK